MKYFVTIIQYELRHFARSPFKIVAFALFIGAAIYGLQNGYTLIKKQQAEIAGIQTKAKEDIALVNSWYDNGKKGPEEKYWQDITLPTWAIWYAPGTVVKKPSPLQVFSMGQAEQFGYYKRVINGSSVFDSDLVEEIANPERLSIGTLDFSFVVFYLLPVLSIVLLFNIGGMEKDLGFNRLLQVGHSSGKTWLAARFVFYFLLMAVSLFVLMLIYAAAAGALPTFLKLYLLILLYAFLWVAVFYFINSKGKGSAGQAIKMVMLWLLFCVAVPGAVQQGTSLKYPAGYETAYVDISRDQKYTMLALPGDSIRNRTLAMDPDLSGTAFAKDTAVDEDILDNSVDGLVNDLLKSAAKEVESRNEDKNRFIRNAYWINPVNFFQNTANHICETDYDAYSAYRNNIQKMIDKKMNFLLKDSWNKEISNKQKFLRYVEAFKDSSIQ